MIKKYALAALFLLACASGALAVGQLRIGLIPEQNIFKQLERYRPVGEYLSRENGLEVKFTILSRYGNIIDTFESEKLDGAFWGSFTGALSMKKLGMIPIARPLNLDGTSTYFGVIFVKKGSGIKSAKDMKGKRIALVDRATTAGYLFPKAFLREKEGVVDFDGYFSKVHFAGSHDAAIKELLSGEADIACAKNTVYEAMAKSDPSIAEKLEMLAISETVPSNALGVRPDLEKAVIDKLRKTLLGMGDTAEGAAILSVFGAKSFIPTGEKDYSPVLTLAKKAGIDPATYSYENK